MRKMDLGAEKYRPKYVGVRNMEVRIVRINLKDFVKEFSPYQENS